MNFQIQKITIVTTMSNKISDSPYAFFDEVLALRKPVLVQLRSGRFITGVLKAYDRHLNLVFSEATETWEENGIEYTEERKNFMLRGDNVIVVVSNS